MSKADFTIESSDSGVALLRLKGQWVIAQLPGVSARLGQALERHDKVRVDATELDSLDTAGAYLLRLSLGDRVEGEIFPENESYARLYALVGAPAEEAVEAGEGAEKPGRLSFWATPFFHHPVFTSLSHLGELVVGFWREFIAQSIFMGHVITLILRSAVQPSRIRWAALFSLMQRAGVEAIPIVVLTNFFVGGVIAFLGIVQLRQFGVSVFAVELVGIAVFREFAPLIAAVLLSGRSASSFAAEIGSMKMNQEIDAMEVMSIDPYEALVLPRLLAMILMMPLVSFIGAIAGLCGGAIVVWSVLHFGPTYFVQRISDYVPFVNFFVGMIKTPVYAAIIALIGCRRGLTVKEDVISLGRQVTTAVVHSIFIIFMFNALFAILFNNLNF
jgi:phospholipid/cholesterol/gamma-HCH transport system permease protein